jgi:hypothetical protein
MLIQPRSNARQVRKRMCILLHKFPDAHRTYASQPFDIIAEPIVPVVLM